MAKITEKNAKKKALKFYIYMLGATYKSGSPRQRLNYWWKKNK